MSELFEDIAKALSEFADSIAEFLSSALGEWK